jgi:hypothetical protein
MEVLIKLCRQGAVSPMLPWRWSIAGSRPPKMKPIRDTVRICLWSLAFRFGP